MTLRSRLLLTTAALSLALGGGYAAAQNRHQPVQSGATQNRAQEQNPNQAQAPSSDRTTNSNQAGAANNNEAQAPQAQGSGGNEAQSSNNNERANKNERMENNARSGQNRDNAGAKAPPSSGNAAQNKQPAGTNQNAERGGTGSNENAAERGTERNENSAQRGGERNENAAERGERNGNAGNRASNRTGNAEQREGSARASSRLSSTEKTKLEGAIGKISIRPATNVNFSVAVGVSVPRTVALHPLPADVVAIVPQYRGYDFFVVRDEIVIVEPSNHRIVDVIERTGGARTAATAKSHKLHLSARDRTYIRKHYETRRTVIDRAGPPRETHIVIGEDVPETVTIERFPREIYHRVPSIRSYGYVHEGRDLYLVEPGTRHVIESLGPDEDD